MQTLIFISIILAVVFCAYKIRQHMKKQNPVQVNINEDIYYCNEHGRMMDQVFRINNYTKLIRTRHEMGVFISKWDMIWGRQKQWLEDKADILEIYRDKDNSLSTWTDRTYFGIN